MSAMSSNKRIQGLHHRAHIAIDKKALKSTIS